MNAQETLDRFLLIALYEHIFGAGEPAFWERTVRGLLARGATLSGKEALSGREVAMLPA